jgi:hypothetical protein
VMLDFLIGFVLGAVSILVFMAWVDDAHGQ